MCITDKAKETSSCADLFRCGAASVCLDCRMFALCLGASVSLIRLPRCYYYTTCKWCMVSHLSSDAGVLLGALAALCCVCCARGCWVCAWAWPCCVPCLLACLCPCGLVLCGCALPCSLVCGPAMPALWAGLVRGPCLWASYKPLLYGPILRPCISGLIWASEKVLYSRLVLRLCISGLFSWLCFRLKISGQIFRASRAGFFLRIFRVDFSGENFPDNFPGFIFRVFSWIDFRGGIWLPLFSRCNIHTIPGSP